MKSFGSALRSFILFVLIMMSVAHDDFHLTILHTHSTNAIISAFEQFDSSGGDCSAAEDRMGECFGGVARRGTVIKEVRNERDDINVLLLDAGDQTGGDWFDFYKGNATAYFMNRLGYDAMTFGNRDFMFGPDELVPFLQKIDFDVVSANLNATHVPVLQGLFNKSVVKTFDGQRVGIVGYSTQVFNYATMAGRSAFEDVFESIQTEVEALTSQGVDKIIVLGHAFPGRDAEPVEIAQRIPGIDVIVMGGLGLHQYDDFYPTENLEGVTEDEIVKYPLVITPNDDPECQVLLVHGIPARLFSDRFIGRLDVVFDEQGKVSAWYGAPISLDKDVRQDPELLAEVEVYAEPFQNASDRFIGTTEVFLQGSISVCSQQECNLGDLIADSMAWQFTSPSHNATNDTVIALVHSRGIRASIEQGDIYYSDIMRVRPFRSPSFKMELQGRIIRELLEHAVSDIESAAGRFLQVSGMEVTFDICKEPYDGRVAEILVVRYLDCRHSYLAPLKDDQMYTVVVLSNLAYGGEGFPMLLSLGTNVEVSDNTVDNVLAEYIELFSPIRRIVEGRITLVDESCEDAPAPTTSPAQPRTTMAKSTVPATDSSVTPTQSASGGTTDSSPQPGSTSVTPTQSATESPTDGSGRDKPRKQ